MKSKLTILILLLLASCSLNKWQTNGTTTTDISDANVIIKVYPILPTTDGGFYYVTTVHTNYISPETLTNKKHVIIGIDNEGFGTSTPYIEDMSTMDFSIGYMATNATNNMTLITVKNPQWRIDYFDVLTNGSSDIVISNDMQMFTTNVFNGQEFFFSVIGGDTSNPFIMGSAVLMVTQ